MVKERPLDPRRSETSESESDESETGVNSLKTNQRRLPTVPPSVKQTLQDLKINQYVDYHFDTY